MASKKVSLLNILPEYEKALRVSTKMDHLLHLRVFIKLLDRGFYSVADEYHSAGKLNYLLGRV